LQGLGGVEARGNGLGGHGGCPWDWSGWESFG